MDFGTECRPEPDVPPSRRAVARGENVSRSEWETLRKSQDFRRVLGKGKRCRIGGIVMVGSPGSSGLPRLGLVVSKGSGNAVTRNRIKRRLRHASDRLRLRQGSDYVIIADRRVADVDFADLEGWLETAAKELANA